MTQEQEGLDKLRRAIEVVATDLEAHPVAARPRRGIPRLAMAAAAAVVIVATVSGWWMLQGPPPDVEVLELRIAGRAVPARIVDGAAPGTILVMPQEPNAPTVSAVAVPVAMLGGTQ
jgi:hypothetical protein